MMFWGLCLFCEEWYQGVIGILVFCIKEQFYCFIIVFVFLDQGELKGLVWFINGFYICDVFDVVVSCYLGLIVKFGGYVMVVGLIFWVEDLIWFEWVFDQEVRCILKLENLIGELISDGVLQEVELDLLVVKMLCEVGFWG